MDDLVEKLKRLAPTSSLMPYYEAKDIAADFGNRVVELMESNRPYLGEGKTPLLPVDRLRHKTANSNGPCYRHCRIYR